MKKSKRLLGILLALSLVLSLCACGAPAASSPTPAATAPEIPTGPAALTFMISGDNTPPDSNSVLKAIEAATNTKLKISYVAAKDASAKLNTLIASKSLPDIFRVSSLADVEELKANGMIIDMAPYLKDAPNITASLGERLTQHPSNTESTTYALFHGEYTYAQNMCIRTDWLKALGMEMPTDLDSLFEVLKAFTFNDPDGNGQHDTIGLQASIVGNWNNFTNILGAYGVPCVSTGLRPYEMSDGTITTGMKNPGFLESVKYFRKLYQEGVMDPDFATIPAMDSFGKLWNGKAGAFDFQCAGPTNNWMPGRYVENPPPTLDFAAIKGPSGVAAQGKHSPGITPSILISSACKDPAAAVRVLDYLMSDEGCMTTYLGIEGTHYNWIDKDAFTYKMIPPYDDAAVNRNDGLYVYSDFLRPNTPAERIVMNQQTKQGVAMADAMCTIEWPFIYTVFEADTIYGNTLKDIEKEVFCQLVASTGDVDKEYTEALARWESEGGADWQKEATEAYKSQK